MKIHNNDLKTREAILQHYKNYPDLQIQDIFKFLYQSVFGPEHFIDSKDAAINNIVNEYIASNSHDLIDGLDGEYCRIPLSYINKGLSAKTLGTIFFLSSKHNEDGLLILPNKLKVAKELVDEGLLPYTKEEFEKETANWAKQGYPALHHSAVFREKYKPSYRVIANDFLPFLPLLIEIDKLLAKNKATIAIEGGSASGKTTLGKTLSDIYNCTVLHMDDFFLRPEQRTPERLSQVGGNIDWERFLEEVLKPLSLKEDVIYKKFDCSTLTFRKGKKIIPTNLVVVEGAYSMHPQLEKYYDFSAFLDIKENLQRERILHRNTPQFAALFFEKWIPLENRYFEKTQIKKRCKIKIDII